MKITYFFICKNIRKFQCLNTPRKVSITVGFFREGVFFLLWGTGQEIWGFPSPRHSCHMENLNFGILREIRKIPYFFKSCFSRVYGHAPAKAIKNQSLLIRCGASRRSETQSFGSIIKKLIVYFPRFFYKVL